VSARAARLLRQRVAATEGLAVRMDRAELLRAVGPPAAAQEPDPDAYVRGLLLHEGLRCTAAAGGDQVELRLEPGRALAGALCVVVPAVVVAFAGLWLYGLVVALAGGAAAFAVRRRWPLVARRAPRAIPRGWLLGAVAAGAAVVLVAVAVVWPVREARRPDNLGSVVVVSR